MSIIAKYKFNQNTYENFIPEFNSGFTDYTYNDEIDTDGYTIRTIGNDSGNLPTLIRFGYISGGITTTQAKSLLSVEYINTSNVTDMNSMFRNCTSLTSLNVSNFDTSKVTDMNCMFHSCSVLTSLDVSNFDTSSVTNMESMFRACTSLTSLDLTSFDTSQVTDMTNMFNTCKLLTSLDLSNFNTSQVTIMNSMFSGCSALTSLNLSNFNTGEVTSMDSMFYGCSKLTSLNISNFNTSKVTSMSNMFYNCYALTSLNLSNFNTSQVTTMASMFYNCTSLTSLDLSNWDTSKVTKTSNMFYSWTSSQKVYASSKWTLGTSFSPTFIITFACTIAKYKFDQNIYANFIPKFNSAFTDYTYTDEIDTDGYTIRTIGNDSGDLPTFIRFGYTSGGVTATQASSLLSVEYINTSNVTFMSNMFSSCTSLTSLDVSNWNTSNVTTMNSMFSDCQSLTSLDLSSFNTNSVTDMYGMFANCTSLASLDVSNFNTNSVTDMTNMFQDCKSLTSLDLSSFNTSKITDMSNMFYDCSSLTSLDVSSFNTGQVTSMRSMFNTCTSLISLDLSNFDTSLVTSMANMFNNCNKLTSLNVSSFDTSQVTDMSSMFNTCTSLTSLDLSNFNTSIVTTMAYMFHNCSSLTSLDVSSFNTGEVTSMYFMFYSCTQLTSLDVSNFDTSKVTIMAYMFNNCTSLTSLDLSNFDTSQVTDMNSMFRICSSLTSLDLSNFNTNKVTNFSNLFEFCSNLVALDISNFHFGGVNQNPSATIFNGCRNLKNIAMIYCRVSSFNSLQNAFNNLIATPVNVYYHDANLSELPTHAKVAYQYYGTSTVTLPYELNKLPNGVADYIDVVNGVYVQRVGKVVLDETLKDNFVPSSTTYFDNLYRWFYKPSATAIKADGSIRTTNVMCDKLRVVDYSEFAERNYEFTSISNDGIDIELMLNESHGSTREILASWLSSNPITVLYQLATPIYTPLTDEEKASLPLSAYSNGYVQLSSDELRPSKFEFRAKSSNRMQLDMLETGHYYLNGSTGNVKLGNVDIDVTEMPCLINVSDASSKRLICDLDKVVLSKLPSHRIPTTFTQGMKSSVDFGYWEGIKNAKPSYVFTTDTVEWKVVDDVLLLNNYNNGIELHSITGYYGGTRVTVEDEIDISTGKYTKRVGKYVIDGTVAPYSGLEYEEEYNIQKVVFLRSATGIKHKNQWNNGLYGLAITDLLKFKVDYTMNEPHIFMSSDNIGLYFKAGTFGAFTVENVQNYFKENPMTVYYELETPEITYLDLERNEFRTTSNRTNLQVHSPDNSIYLKPQVKPSPLSYPTTLSPNTQYTVFHNRKNYSGSVKTPMINLGGAEVSATGSRTVVTTPSTLAHNELQFIGGENTVEQVMVLHGDWTKEGKTVDYFEGLQSSVIGDKTLENLVDEPTDVWSSNVTDVSNGGAVDYVSMDDILVGYGNRPKLPEVQVDTNVHSCGMTLQNLAVQYECIAEPNAFIRVAVYNGVLPIGTYIFFYNVVEPNPTNQSGGSRFTPYYTCQDGKTYYEGWETHNQTTGLKYWKFTVTSPIIAFSFWIGNINASCSANNFMLLQYQQDMENWNIPFFEGMKSVENPIYHSVGKNLFDGVFTRGWIEDSTGTINVSPRGVSSLNYIPIKPNTLYRFTHDLNAKEYPNFVYRFYFYDKDKNYIGKQQNLNDTYVKTDLSNVAYTRFRLHNANGNITQEYANESIHAQLEQGTQATPYEPYKSSILSTPQGTVLRGVGSYKDVIGWNDGIIRRNCVEFTITGEEGYNISGITENTNTILCGIPWKYLGLENKILASDNVNMAICDKLPSMRSSEDTPHIRQSGGQPYSDNLMFWFDKTKFSTYTSQGINDYIKSIGGLTIVAPLADTQYEDVEFTGGGNWNKIILNGSEHWQEATEGDIANGFSVWVGINENAMKDYGNDNVSKYYLIESEELDWLKYSQIVGSRRTNFVVMNNTAMIVNVEGCHSVNEVKAWMTENPITVWYQTTSNTTTNTDPLIFNHGAVYTSTDTHPSTFLDFTLKTTNRYAVKDFDKLKYTVLTKQPFYLNGVDYPASSTGMTIIDVTNVIDTSIYSDDPMITVVQEDGSYYADGVLQQFKGEQTFVKEFIRTSNGTYNTGMTLLEPLELGMAAKEDGSYDTYNPITGILHKNTRTITITSDEIKSANISITTTSNSLGGYSFMFTYTVGTENVCVNINVVYTNTLFGASRFSMGNYGVGRLYLYFHYHPSYGSMTVDDFKNLVTEDLVFTYKLATPQIIQATPTSTYISTRPENGNIIAQDTQIQAEYLNYDNEQSIISPRMLGDGDTIRWEQGSQCYVYENDNEYIPLTEHDELFGANIQAQEYTQYVESVEGAKVELGIALKEKAVYEQTYVKYEDTIIYPETMENIDETNGVEVDYICGATWQNPNDLSDIRHLGELREDGQYDVTIRRSGDDEIRLLEGTTNINLDYDELPPTEFELTFFNSGGVEVGKYGDTTHVLEDCVQDSKLASSTVYGQTLVNLIDFKANSYQAAGSVTSRGINTITFTTNNTGKFNIGCTVDLKPSAKYCIKANIQSTNSVAFRVLDVKANQYKINETILTNGEYIGTFTASSYATTGQVTFYRGTTVGEETITGTVTLIEYIDGCENWLEHFEGIHSTVVNGFSSCGKNLVDYTQFNYEINSDFTLIDGGYEINFTKPGSRIDITIPMKVVQGKTYTVGATIEGSAFFGGLIGAGYYWASPTTAKYTLIATGNADEAVLSIKNTETLGKAKVTNIFFYEGGDNVYTPSKGNVYYQLSTPITLRKVGDVCDTFDVVSGVETRNTVITTITGDSHTIDNSDNTEEYRQFIVRLNTNEYVKRLARTYVETDEYYIYTSANSQTNVYIRMYKQDDLTDSFDVYRPLLIDYLNNNPLTIMEEAYTPTTTQHTLIPSTTQTTQEPTFILPQPLRSVPNGICDRLYWDENKGHYCIEKRIESEILDGSTKLEGKYVSSESFGDITSYFIKKGTMFKTGTADNQWMGYSQYFKNLNAGLLSKKTEEGVHFRSDTGNIYFKIKLDKLAEDTTIGFSQWLEENKPEIIYAHITPKIIDLPHLDEKVELPTQPNIYPIGYKAVHEKANPEIGLTIPYKVLNMPTQPTNLNFVMDIADYVLTWDDVKEARQYNVILNDNVIATVKEPHWNSGEEMYGYVLVEAQNEIGDSLSKELYIKTVPNAPAQLTVAHNPQTDFYDFEISFVDTSEIAEYFTVMYRVDNGEWVVEDIPAEDLELNTKVLIRFSIYEIKECIEVWATATNDVGTNDILPSAIYYMSPTPQWTYRINSKEAFLRWLDESPYDVQYKLRYSYKSNGAYQYAYFEGDASEIGKLYEAVLPLAEDDEVTVALCIISEKENLYSKPVTVSKALDPNIVPPLNFSYHWLARGLIEFYWEDQYNVDVEYEYILESMKSGEVLWETITEVIPSRDVSGTGEVYKVEHQLEDLEQIRMKVRMKWAMNETEWSETLTTVFIPVEGNPPTYIRRTQTAEGLLIEWEAQSYIDGYHIYVIDNKTGEELQHIETLDNSILVDIDYSKSIEIAIYEISRFSGGIEADATDPMVFTPTMLTTDIEQRIYQPTMEEYLIETSTVQKGSKEAYIIHDSTYTPNVETEEVLGVGISTPFIISYHPMAVDVHQAGSRIENTINAHIKTLDTRTEELVNVMTFERTTATYDLDFRVYTPSTASYPINVDISKVRIVCLGDSLTSGHPFYWAETGTGDVTASYPYQLSRRLKNQYEVINSGYGSDTTDRCIARFDRDVLAYSPQYCIFQCGTND